LFNPFNILNVNSLSIPLSNLSEAIGASTFDTSEEDRFPLTISKGLLGPIICWPISLICLLDKFSTSSLILVAVSPAVFSITPLIIPFV